MSRFLVPTLGPSDWRRLLADPQKHWRQGKSAYELAVAWEAARHSARGLPKDVADLLDSNPDLRGAELLLSVPEHQVVLQGGGHASQTDLWALLRTPAGLVSAAVEGKAGEGFDKPVSVWLQDAKPRSGKPQRLKQLCHLLEITEVQAHRCRYQLLHRTAAAIIEAQRFGITRALLLVQSFVRNPESVADFRRFGEELGAAACENRVVCVGYRAGVQLWLAWATSSPASNQQARADLA